MPRCLAGPSLSRAPTPPVSTWRSRTTRTSPLPHASCLRRCAPTSRRSIRSRGLPTTSRMKGTASASDRLARLDEWRDRLHEAATATGGRPAAADRDALVLLALGHSIRTLDLPLSLFDDLLSAFGQDTTTTRYASWRDVFDYCRRSANPVGRLVLRIAGRRDEALDRSSDALCTALQLTNFWQDFGRDWQAGRLYVPAGCSGCVRRQRSRPVTGPDDAGLDGSDRDVRDRDARPVSPGANCVRWSERTPADRAQADLAWGAPRSGEGRARAGGPARETAHAQGVRPAAASLARGVVGRSAGLMARKTSFYYAFLVLPADQRRAIIAVWDFCRAVDDAVDESTTGAREAVAFWRAELARCYDGGAPQTSQGTAASAADSSASIFHELPLRMSSTASRWIWTMCGTRRLRTSASTAGGLPQPWG